MTIDEIHKLPYKAQLYINKLERKLTLTDVVKPFCEHKAKLLTKKEVEENRSSAYKYLDI